MAASLKGKRTPITTPPYQVPSVDITPDPPIFSLVTTFNVISLSDGLRIPDFRKSEKQKSVHTSYTIFLANIFLDIEGAPHLVKVVWLDKSCRMVI
jgi:hypothetical protein